MTPTPPRWEPRTASAEEVSKGFGEALGELRSLIEDLIIHAVGRQLRSERAKEYSLQGLMRRLRIIKRTAETIFRISPPDRTELFEREERDDLNIQLHAYVMNLYGALDNIAWIYVLETELPWSRVQQVSLFSGPLVQESLPAPARQRLQELAGWHNDYVKDFRDAVAHRIPLYVPPYVATDQQAPRRLAMIMTHSLSEAEGVIFYGPQIVADIRTVIEIARLVLGRWLAPVEPS